MIALGRAAAVAATLTLAVGVAEADSFGGIAANEKSYLVGASRVCSPVVVTAGAAAGSPACHAAPADEVARMSTRLPSAERGPKAALTATAKGRALTVAGADGAAVATWTSADTISRVVDVWQSPTGRLIVVEFVVRRAGRELHDVVGLDRGLGRGEPPATPPSTEPPTAPPPTDPPTAVVDPQLARVVAAARKAKGKTALKGWLIVLSLAPDHPEALYRLAAIDAAGKRADAAIARLEALAQSKAPDALEWLVDARFDKAFAKLVGAPRFRAAVGFDRAATATYERLMGLGGEWEQPLAPCDRPELRLTLRRDRRFTLQLRTSCQGSRDKVTYRGTWAATGDALTLQLPKPDTGDDQIPCRLAVDKDEDVLRCQVDEELAFEARPSRR
ncbi:MAG: hypothetical protein IPH44_10705 [Myxococcales bacterium]|nr:hypothetical protein [Myxococcales bacterium]MBK7195752.1 hypothetical protein [Myxococcales bacterium]MBP6844387.1 hypothetical protein [Kofleriaceae bacterium]